MSTPQSAKGHFQTDWLISNLRWLLLISVAFVSLLDAFINHDVYDDPLSFLPQAALLIIAICYNLIIMFLLSYSTLPRVIPTLTLLVDTALAISFIATSGGLESPLLFFALFPILTAALRFPWVSSLLIAIAVIAGSGITGYFVAPPDISWSNLVSFAVPSLILLLTALISGLVGNRVKQAIAHTRQLEKAAEQRKLRAAREHSRLTFELASTLSATLNYNKVLEAVLEVGEEGMHELGRRESDHVSMVMLFGHNDLRIVTSRHLSPRDRNVAFQGKSGTLAQTLATAETVITNNPGADPELGRLIVMQSCRQAIAVPLRAGFENFGAVVFASSQPEAYTEDLQNLLIAICNQAIVALQNAQLYHSLREEKERIVAVEEDARKKLARDLHDGPTQSIASIAMRVNFTRMLLENGSDPQQAFKELAQIEELARNTTKEIRHMLFTLRPLILETQGLQAALGQYVSKLAKTEKISIHLEATPKVDQVLDQEAQGVIFYIIEEAIGNARKHAQAENVWIRLYLQDHNRLIVEVEDDGKGFDVEAVQTTYDERGSLGLINMYERAELVDGRLTISSAPDRGTQIKLLVPLDTE
jgi:signal transduction histidine kinase